LDNQFPKQYPEAQLVLPNHSVREQFPDGRPIGAVIHHTADRDLARVRSTLDSRGLGYHLIIARDGSVTQHGWLTHQMWHAGKALWQGYSPNHRFVGVSLLSWGEVKLDTDGKYKSWSGSIIPAEDIQHRAGNLNSGFYYWDSATPEQFLSLVKVCVWLSKNGVYPKLVCGHDECALPKGRKSDPGGVLPVTMEVFREMIQQKSRPLQVLS
jgi:N-acetyl-anhydromuramyl-L-alanine amidase AmpD